MWRRVQSSPSIPHTRGRTWKNYNNWDPFPATFRAKYEQTGQKAKSNRSLNIQCPDRTLWTATTSITATVSQTKNTSTYVYGCTLHMRLFTLYSFLLRGYFYLHCSFLNTTLNFYLLQNIPKTASRTGVQLFHISKPILWKYFSGHQLQNFPRISYS